MIDILSDLLQAKCILLSGFLVKLSVERNSVLSNMETCWTLSMRLNSRPWSGRTTIPLATMVGRGSHIYIAMVFFLTGNVINPTILREYPSIATHGAFHILWPFHFDLDAILSPLAVTIYGIWFISWWVLCWHCWLVLWTGMQKLNRLTVCR